MSDPAPLPVVRPHSELDDLARLGLWLSWSESGKDDERSKGAAAALRLYYARELGLTPMAAAELTVINGKLYVGAALLRALARRNGYKVQRLTTSDNPITCTARIIDRTTGEVLGESTFTIEDAQRAGLIRDRSPWKTHPARMLWARASKNVIVDFAPEVALGIALDDELQELPATNGDLPWVEAETVPDYRPPPEQEPLPVDAVEDDEDGGDIELLEDDPATDGADTTDIEF
jgi:hypothetical protein